MTKPVRFAAAAREEFLAGVLRYGARFRSAVNAAARSLGRFPKAWGAYPGHVAHRSRPFVIVGIRWRAVMPLRLANPWPTQPRWNDGNFGGAMLRRTCRAPRGVGELHEG
jgi:hypothetical protein